jgi:membrane associated rhomboid family serine protease
MFLLTFVLQSQGIDLIRLLSLPYVGSPNFRPYQIVTHMFMHGGIEHILFNMFALWIFGSALENVWGTKRFLFFYFFCGLGAAIIEMAATYLQVHQFQDIVNTFILHPSPQLYDQILTKYSKFFDNPDFLNYLSKVSYYYNGNPNDPSLIQSASEAVNKLFVGYQDIPTLGASGAIFGLLVAFGYLFPNTELYLMFIPIPIKAKYLVVGYAAVELFLGFSGMEPGVAHFAHLGGALFGFLLVYYWNKRGKTFY